MNFKRLIYIASIVFLIIAMVNYIGETYSKFKTSSLGKRRYSNCKMGNCIKRWSERTKK